MSDSPLSPTPPRKLRLWACNCCGLVRASDTKPLGLCQTPRLSGPCWGEYEYIEELQITPHSTPTATASRKKMPDNDLQPAVPSETDVEALLKQIDNSFGLDDDASTRIKFKSLRSLATALREARDTGSAGTPCTRCGKDILWAIDDNKWLCQACQRISDLESELAESRAALQRAEAERDEWKRLHDADTRILDDIERTVESAEIESWDEEQNPIQLADRVDILSDKRDAAENDLAVERTRAERAEAERDEARSQLARSLQKP